MEDLVFAFQAPNDGCFAFNTKGTNFNHGIQLMDSCDATEALSCTAESNRLEHEMIAEEEVLVVIDGTTGSEMFFNLSINELNFDVSIWTPGPEFRIQAIFSFGHIITDSKILTAISVFLLTKSANSCRVSIRFFDVIFD